jgi:phage terminase large subunit-like protein
MDNVPYLRWATMANTNLYLTDGDVIDPGAIRSRIKHDAECWRIEQIRYDPYAMEETRQILEFQMGFNMCEVAQTPNSMSPAFNQVQTLVTEGKLKHPDNPILNWCLGNCRPKLDKNDRLMIVKSSDIQRIDGVDALAIALTYWLDDKNKAPAPPTGQQWAVQW